MADEQNVESPTLEQPQTKAKSTPEIDIDAVMAELERAGVQDAESLKGKLDAGSQVGRMANLLGDANRRIEELEQSVMAQQRNRQQRPVQRDTFDLDDFQSGQTIDLEQIEAAAARGVRKETISQQRAQMQAQQQSAAMWGAIQGDKDYHLVRDVMEAKMSDPTYSMRIQMGQINPMMDYHNTVVDFFRGVTRKSLDTIKVLQGGRPITTPTVETGQVAGANIVSADNSRGNERVEYLKKLKQKANKGGRLTEQEELALLDGAFSGIPVEPSY